MGDGGKFFGVLRRLAGRIARGLLRSLSIGRIHYSNQALKIRGSRFFYKVGRADSPLLISELENSALVKGHLGSICVVPLSVARYSAFVVVKYPAVRTSSCCTLSEAIAVLAQLAGRCENRACDIRDLDFVEEFNRLFYALDLDAQLGGHELRTLMGPMHGDFHRRNILKSGDSLFIIDFDLFAVRGIHLFDLINIFVSEKIFERRLAWDRAFAELVRRRCALEIYPGWASLTPAQQNIHLLLYLVWRSVAELKMTGAKLSRAGFADMTALIFGESHAGRVPQ